MYLMYSTYLHSWLLASALASKRGLGIRNIMYSQRDRNRGNGFHFCMDVYRREFVKIVTHQTLSTIIEIQWSCGTAARKVEFWIKSTARKYLASRRQMFAKYSSKKRKKMRDKLSMSKGTSLRNECFFFLSFFSPKILWMPSCRDELRIARNSRKQVTDIFWLNKFSSQICANLIHKIVKTTGCHRSIRSNYETLGLKGLWN